MAFSSSSVIFSAIVLHVKPLVKYTVQLKSSTQRFILLLNFSKKVPHEYLEVSESMELNTWYAALTTYWWGLFRCLFRGGTYHELRQRVPTVQARVQIYWLALSLRLWSYPHYRSGTFQNDLRKNLRNVAIPKTGVPLSLVCMSRLVAYPFVMVVIPMLCFVSSIICAWVDGTHIGSSFAKLLLNPVRESLLSKQNTAAAFLLHAPIVDRRLIGSHFGASTVSLHRTTHIAQGVKATRWRTR